MRKVISNKLRKQLQLRQERRQRSKLARLQEELTQQARENQKELEREFMLRKMGENFLYGQ